MASASFLSKFPDVEQLLLAVEVSIALGEDKQAREIGSKSNKALLKLLAVLHRTNTLNGVPVEQQPKEIQTQMEAMLTKLLKDGTVFLDVPRATLLFSVAYAIGNNKSLHVVSGIDLTSAMMTSPGLAIIWEQMAESHVSHSQPWPVTSPVLLSFDPWDGIKHAGDTIKDAAQKVVDGIKSTAEKAKKTVEDAAHTVAAGWDKAWSDIEKEAQRKIWDNVEPVSKDTWDRIVQAMDSLPWDEVDGTFRKLVDEYSHFKIPKDGTMVSILEGLPVIGYVVAIAHCAAGDNDEALRAVGKSTQALLTLIGASAGSAVLGPAGAMAGAALGSAIGMGIKYALGELVHDGKVKASMQDLNATRVIIDLLLGTVAGTGASQVGEILAEELIKDLAIKGMIKQFLFSKTMVILLNGIMAGIPKHMVINAA